jgi:hypothetical protein
MFSRKVKWKGKWLLYQYELPLYVLSATSWIYMIFFCSHWFSCYLIKNLTFPKNVTEKQDFQLLSLDGCIFISIILWCKLWDIVLIISIKLHEHLAWNFKVLKKKYINVLISLP